MADLELRRASTDSYGPWEPPSTLPAKHFTSTSQRDRSRHELTEVKERVKLRAGG